MEIIGKIDKSREIQKYMNFSKFMHLIDSRKLFLSRASFFEDKLEGGLTSLDALIQNGFAASLDIAMNSIWPTTAPRTKEEKEKQQQQIQSFEEKTRTINTAFGNFPKDTNLETLNKQQREWVDVSCWHMNKSESMAMWKIYGGGTDSVCIVSSIENLENSITSPNDRELLLSEVHYIEHENDSFKTDHLLAQFFHKSNFYEFESEVRIISYNPKSPLLENRKESDSGTLIDISPEKLISEIRISHDSPQWFYNLVKSIVQEKYKLGIEVKRSMMNKPPIYG